MNSSRYKGNQGEEIAVRCLTSKGYRILQRNYHSRFGEIDIIAANSQYIVFVEVKLRREDSWVSPVEAVTRAKRNRILQTALCYFAECPTQLQPRFDIIEIWEPFPAEGTYRVRTIENAFSLEVGNGIF